MRVLVSSPNPLALAGLAALLEGAPGVDSLTRAAPAEAAVMADAAGADTLLLDATGDQGVELVADTVEACRGLPLVAVVTEPAAARAALTAGAAGAVRQDVDQVLLLAALAAAAAGLVVLMPDAAGPLLGPLVPDEGRELPIEPLTARELDVLQLLASGMTNPRISHALEISENTVKFHVTSILGKLGAANRAEAVARAAGLGLILV